MADLRQASIEPSETNVINLIRIEIFFNNIRNYTAVDGIPVCIADLIV